MSSIESRAGIVYDRYVAAVAVVDRRNGNIFSARRTGLLKTSRASIAMSTDGWKIVAEPSTFAVVVVEEARPAVTVLGERSTERRRVIEHDAHEILSDLGRRIARRIFAVLELGNSKIGGGIGAGDGDIELRASAGDRVIETIAQSNHDDGARPRGTIRYGRRAASRIRCCRRYCNAGGFLEGDAVGLRRDDVHAGDRGAETSGRNALGVGPLSGLLQRIAATGGSEHHRGVGHRVAETVAYGHRDGRRITTVVRDNSHVRCTQR